MTTPHQHRREFLRLAAAGAGGLILAGCGSAGATGSLPASASRSTGRQAASGTPAANATQPDEGISPVEDLMREHGLLRRILLVYEEAGRRIDAKEAVPVDAVAQAAGIVHKFVEDYHERLEEKHLFPRFRMNRKLVELVDQLDAQHQAGRKLTLRIESLASAAGNRVEKPPQAAQLADAMRQFIRMYRPHAAREDTVLFPAFKSLLSPKEYDEMGDRFESAEQQLFGEQGFEHMVERVAGLEKTLGIHDLAKFTPKTSG